jgi:hypothetical protein
MTRGNLHIILDGLGLGVKLRAGLLQQQMHTLRRQPTLLRFRVQIPEQLCRIMRRAAGADDPELIAAAVDLYAQPSLDLVQVLIERATQARQSIVVDRLERDIEKFRLGIQEMRLANGLLREGPSTRTRCSVPIMA